MANNRIGVTLTEEEFKDIKDRQFKGELKAEIIAHVGRSDSTVKSAMEANSLEEYRKISRAKWAKYGKSSERTVLVQTLSPTTRYGRLKAFREKFDEVLIEFILSEVEENNKELVKENKQLKRENEQLKQKLEEGDSSTFIHGLQSRLQPNQEQTQA